MLIPALEGLEVGSKFKFDRKADTLPCFNMHYIRDWANFRGTYGISWDPTFDQNWSFTLPDICGDNVFFGGCAEGKIKSFWKNMEMSNDVIVNLAGSNSTVGLAVGSKF